MISNPFRPKKFSLGKALEMLNFLRIQLPSGENLPDIEGTARSLDGRAQENFLRQVYMNIEQRILSARSPEWPDANALRLKMGLRFGFSRALPSAFTVFFLPYPQQLFFLLRVFLEGMWQRLTWPEDRVMTVIHQVGVKTPFAAMINMGDEEWQKVFLQLQRGRGVQKEGVITAAMKPIIERTYRDFITERGEAQARIGAEETVRKIQHDFGTLEAISGLLAVLPQGVLEKERISLASREELVEAVARQMQEMMGKNIALVYEAKQLHETIQKLQQAKEQAEAMAQAQQEFITVVSHQFRTPLSAIRWQADALIDAASDGQPDVGMLKNLGIGVRERSVFLIGVLENIFDLLAIQSGNFVLHTKRVPVASIISESCTEFTKEAERRGVKLVCQIEKTPMLLIDAKAITRVLGIVLTNAIQYSSEGQEVRLSVKKRERNDGGVEVIVSIQDFSIGIRPEDRTRVFTKFFRSRPAVAKAPDGAGIGNFIAKHIIEMHGGKMWVESVGEGVGSTFFFSLPEPPREAAAPTASAIAKKDTSPSLPPHVSPSAPPPATPPASAPAVPPEDSALPTPSAPIQSEVHDPLLGI